MARRDKCNCGNCLCRVTKEGKQGKLERCGIRPPTSNGQPSAPGWCTYWTRKDGFQPFRHFSPPLTWTVARPTSSGEVAHGV
jgi:hypothetical protein